MVVLDPAHLVGIGGMIGAILRHEVSRRLSRGAHPIGTLTVNVLGTFVLGLVVFAGAEENVLLFVGPGICGAFTTFSSFSVETVRLWEGGYGWRAFGNALGNLLGAGGALFLAWAAVTLMH